MGFGELEAFGEDRGAGVVGGLAASSGAGEVLVAVSALSWGPYVVCQAVVGGCVDGCGV